jgi:hypothetical protein
MIKANGSDSAGALKVVLIEYKTLRKGMMEKFRIHMLLFSITILSSLIAVSIAFATHSYDILHLLSFISLTCFFRLAWEQALIRKVSAYLKIMEEKTIPALVGATDNSLIMGWQHYYEASTPPEKYFKHGFMMGFVVLSALLSLTYAVFAIALPFGCCTAATRLPIEINAVLLVIHFAITIWIFNKIKSY